MDRARRTMARPPGTPLRPGRAGWLAIGGAIAGLIVIAALTFRPGSALVGPGPLAPATSGPSAPPVPGHEVYGFVPYWEIDADIAEHLRATDVTTVALFSITHTGNGALATTGTGARRITGPIGRRIVADAHRAGRRVDVTWTSFGPAKNRKLFASEDLQATVIANLVAFRAEHGFDGIAADVEELDPVDLPAYGTFLGRLRDALRAADPGATLTVATGAGAPGVALAVAANLAGADRIFLMGYDYRTAGSQPGASAPIVRRDAGQRSLSWSLDLYLAAGIPAEKTILGLPLYGLAWPATGAELGAASTAKGEIWVPRRNLPLLHDPAVTLGYDDVEQVGFLSRPDGAGWRAVYYDTPRSLRPKLALANDRGLAGAGFWALGYERGLPEYTDLIAAFRAGDAMSAAGAGG